MELANVVNIYITNHRNNSVALPVAPEEVSINDETDDATETIMGYRQINKVGEKKLRTITISSVLPLNTNNVSYVTAERSQRWINAESYLTFLKNIVNDKQPCRVVITGTDISMQATMTMTHGMKDGNAQEYNYQLEFTEFVPVFAEKIRHKRNGKTRRPVKKGKRRSKPSHKISRGSKVLVNGYAYLTKNASHGVMIRKRRCHVVLISKGSKHPYFVRDIYGTNMGWIGRSSIK